MAEIYFISDTHLNHANILKFKDKNGKPIRDFHDVHHMNEIILNNWNKVVKPGDKVYHLGDVYFGPTEEANFLLSRLNGKKRLIVGNHDDIKSSVLHRHFQKIYMWRIFSDFGLVLTHVPVHESVLYEGRFKNKQAYNVHGHIHQNKSPTKQHVNLCVEQTDYMPIHIDQVEKLLRKQHGLQG